MTDILLCDARLTSLQSEGTGPDRFPLLLSRMVQYVRNISSRMGVHPDPAMMEANNHNSIVVSDSRSPELVREGNGLPLRIVSALPKCPLVVELCAADSADGKSS